MRLKISRILLISTLSVSLMSCAGNPPKLERKVKYYGGVPSRKSLCRSTKESLVDFLKKFAIHDLTRANAEAAVDKLLVDDGTECVSADSKEFSSMVGIRSDDLRVLLQFQENLLYSCEKWKQ